MCIKLHFYLILILIYFYAVHRLNLFLLFYLFAIFHEFAHILIALALNIKIKEIFFLPVGVCAKYDYIDNKIKEILVAASGPLFSIIVFLIAKDEFIKEINLDIAFLNLIPIYPMDGGRVLRGILEYKVGYRKSVIISNKISQFLLIALCMFGIIFAVYFKNYSLILLGIYVFFLIREELKKERIIKTIKSLIGE